MAFTHTIGTTYVANGGSPVTTSFTESYGLEVNISETITAASTDQLVALTLDVSQMKTFFLYCSTRDMTLETNSGSAPAATVNLKAGKPIVWHSAGGMANPFGSTDVTALYVTLAAGDNATLEIRALIDPTI